jgi:hypothetical protein
MRNAKKGETTSFAVAASTSVRPERGSARPVGAAVTVESLSYPHTAEVLYDSGRVGLDGRHWVKVAVRTGSGPAWGVHVEATDLL